MRKYTDIQDIMLRYLNGEASAEESTVLHDWVGRNKSNSEEFEITKRLWEDSTDALTIPIDKKKAWQAVSNKTVGKHRKNAPLFLWKWKIAIAAALVAIISTIYFITSQSPSASWNVTLAYDNNKTIELPDGSRVILRKGSSLSLPEHFGEGTRTTKLNGIAYFEITENNRIPFIVITSNSIIRDIGTAFIVESYDSIEQVTVIKGEVSFANKNGTENQVILEAGESAFMNHKIPQRKNVDTVNALSWHSKILLFNNTPLYQVANDLENYFLVNVELTGNINMVPVTAEFRNESLHQVLKELALLTGLKFQRKGNTLVISK